MLELHVLTMCIDTGIQSPGCKTSEHGTSVEMSPLRKFLLQQERLQHLMDVPLFSCGVDPYSCKVFPLFLRPKAFSCVLYKCSVRCRQQTVDERS